MCVCGFSWKKWKFRHSRRSHDLREVRIHAQACREASRVPILLFTNIQLACTAYQVLQSMSKDIIGSKTPLGPVFTKKPHKS